MTLRPHIYKDFEPLEKLRRISTLESDSFLWAMHIFNGDGTNSCIHEVPSQCMKLLPANENYPKQQLASLPFAVSLTQSWSVLCATINCPISQSGGSPSHLVRPAAGLRAWWSGFETQCRHGPGCFSDFPNGYIALRRVGTPLWPSIDALQQAEFGLE